MTNNRIVSFLKRGIKRALLTKAERRHLMVGPSELWRMKRDFQIQFLRSNGLKPEHYLLDIGCGTLRGGIPLIAYLLAGHYTGVESRSSVLEEGRKELHEARLLDKHPTLLMVPDISELDLDQSFDFIWAFSVLFHMSDEILAKTLSSVSKHLSDTGVFFGNVNLGSGKEGRWQRFPVVWRSFEFYRTECSRVGLALSNLGPLHQLGHVSNEESHDNQVMLRIAKG